MLEKSRKEGSWNGGIISRVLRWTVIDTKIRQGEKKKKKTEEARHIPIVKFFFASAISSQLH